MWRLPHTESDETVPRSVSNSDCVSETVAQASVSETTSAQKSSQQLIARSVEISTMMLS